MPLHSYRDVCIHDKRSCIGSCPGSISPSCSSFIWWPGRAFISVDSFSPFVGYSVQSCRLVVDISVEYICASSCKGGSSPFCHYSLSHFSVFLSCINFQTNGWGMNEYKCRVSSVTTILERSSSTMSLDVYRNLQSSSQSCVRVSMTRRRRRLWALLTRLVTMVCTIF